MLPLALNTVLPQSMQVKYQLLIGALPICLMFASFIPAFFIVAWLEAHFPIPANSSITDQPNGGAWLALFLFGMITLMILGYAIGWVINAAVSRYVLGWSPEKVRSVYLQSDVPAHWLREQTASPGSADAQSIAKWEVQRKVGALRFIAVRGVLSWGGPMLVGMYFLPTFVKGQGFSLESTLFSIALWACAGACFGALIWFGSEANFRKLKQRNLT